MFGSEMSLECIQIRCDEYFIRSLISLCQYSEASIHLLRIKSSPSHYENEGQLPIHRGQLRHNKQTKKPPKAPHYQWLQIQITDGKCAEMLKVDQCVLDLVCLVTTRLGCSDRPSRCQFYSSQLGLICRFTRDELHLWRKKKGHTYTDGRTTLMEKNRAAIGRTHRHNSPPPKKNKTTNLQPFSLLKTAVGKNHNTRPGLHIITSVASRITETSFVITRIRTLEAGESMKHG